MDGLIRHLAPNLVTHPVPDPPSRHGHEHRERHEQVSGSPLLEASDSRKPLVARRLCMQHLALDAGRHPATSQEGDPRVTARSPECPGADVHQVPGPRNRLGTGRGSEGVRRPSTPQGDPSRVADALACEHKYTPPLRRHRFPVPESSAVMYSSPWRGISRPAARRRRQLLHGSVPWGARHAGTGSPGSGRKGEFESEAGAPPPDLAVGAVAGLPQPCSARDHVGVPRR